ncbi:MAG: glucose 1-dehydrogenase [Chloroflexi bacterium]|nr:glucose 1-dehydrogenase [Chloroflexota bacterium]
MTAKLDGKVSFVTGAASGLGRATAIRYASEGSKIAVSDLNQAGGEETVASIKAAGGDAFFVKADVTREADVKAAVDATLKNYGRLDVLAACAGIAHDTKPITDFTVDEWEKVMAVNVRGVFLSAKHSIPHMQKQGGGKIVVIVSDSAFVAGEGQTAYCASKGAALLLVRALSVDCAKLGIRVNCVCPSIADTPMVRDYLGAKPGESLTQYDIPDFNTPEQIAGHMLFLASDDSANMNGQSLVVDFGGLAKSTFPF